MAFVLHISIQDDSEEARAIQQVADAEHVSPEKAAKILLVEGAKFHGTKTPVQEMWGAFSGPEDVSMLDDIVTEAYALRLADQPRELGI